MTPTFPDEESAFTYFRELLENHDLNIILDSPSNEYQVQYYVGYAKDHRSKNEVKIRKHRLLDKARGTVTPEPWDTFNLDGHVRIIRALIHWNRYRLTLISGWRVRCPRCSHQMTGEPWKPLPKQCTSGTRPRCKQAIEEDLVTSIVEPITNPTSTKDLDKAWREDCIRISDQVD